MSVFHQLHCLVRFCLLFRYLDSSSKPRVVVVLQFARHPHPHPRLPRLHAYPSSYLLAYLSTLLEISAYNIDKLGVFSLQDMLRRGYYTALELARNNTLDGEQPHMDVALPHMEHCFDYIRQSLMCAADPTLEKRNDTIGGVTGWGTSHQCRDFSALQDWAEMHRYVDR